MGFGTLFIGYFLLLNIAIYSFTDIIAGAVMLLGLYNLSCVNKYFKIGTWISLAFTLFGAVELYFGISDMFLGVATPANLLSIFSAIRFLLVGALTVIILLGIKTVSIEVELEDMPLRCSSRVIMSCAIFGLGFILELPFVSFIGDRTLYVLAALTVLTELIIVAMNLTVIYGAYMKICMPKDNLPTDNAKPKESRFGFVNQYRERKAEKAKEEAEYRLNKLKELSEKNNGGKKKK